MDLLMSLPIASYFFSTSLTSWSTSLNLLFFYMTWSTLVLSHSPLKIELIATTALRILFWLIPSLVFLLIDTILPSLSSSIKHNGPRSLPPRDPAALARLLALALFNLALTTAAEAALSSLSTLATARPLFHTATTLPLPWQIAKHLALLFLLREALTYLIHRHLLHNPSSPSSLPRRLTALHVNHAHAHPGPHALLLNVDHPLPFLLHRFAPLYLPAAALSLLPVPVGGDVHLLTYLLFVALATVESTLAMSGYTIVPGILMGGAARRTAAHYACGGRGNYGCWGLVDWACGTSVGGDDVVGDVKREADKHRVAERGGGAMRDGMEGLRRSVRMRSRRGE
ncbi:sterol desaturase family [Podospora conica]|nr:sterol desaturase family [Schizothecium conicum]